MEYGLSPPRRIKSRRNREMVKKQVSTMRRRRRLVQVVTGTFPCGQQMKKYGHRTTAACMLSQKAREECGGSWNGELPRRQSATSRAQGALDKRLGQKEVVTAAHNAWIRELLQEVNEYGRAGRHMKLLTIETESRLGTLWDQEECDQFCSKEELWESARDEEMKIPWRASNEGPPVPEEQYQERFWWRRLDGIGLETVTKEFLVIEFKRTQDANSTMWKAQQQFLRSSTRACWRVSKRSVKSKSGRYNR
jgi:hypothetical protein